MRNRFQRRSVALVTALVLALGAGAVRLPPAPARRERQRVSIGPAAVHDRLLGDGDAQGPREPGQGQVARLLPDTQSSARYVQFDAPYLTQAFEAAGLSSDDFKIDNAQGSAQTMQTQAEAAITDGATRAARRPARLRQRRRDRGERRSKGVKVIDYDRLTLGGPATATTSASTTSSVGKLIGQGLVDCIDGVERRRSPNVLVMNGDPTDNNAKLFAQGYNAVLKPHFDDGTYVKVGEPAGTWDPSTAPRVPAAVHRAHEHQRRVTPNDDIANAVISVPARRSRSRRRRSRPPARTRRSWACRTSSQGYQCGTVYKPIYLEAQAAAALAIYLRAGQSRRVAGQRHDRGHEPDRRAVGRC